MGDNFALSGGATGGTGYDAAGVGRRLRTWRPSNLGPNAVTAYSLDLIRSRSRGAARNDPWAGTALDKLVSNTIGTGIQAKARTKDKAYAEAVKAVWDRWAKVADADGVLDLYGLQALACREWHEAGEVFVRLRSRRLSDGLPVPLQIQLIEPEQCPSTLYQTASNGNQIRAGIEFNAIGRRVAYWMYTEHPGDMTLDPLGVGLVRVPAEQILHVFEPTRAGQIRGVPHMTATLLRMLNLDSMDDAVLERQKLANLFAGFYTTTAGEGDSSPGMLAGMATQTDDDGTPMAGLEPGTMQELPPGQQVEFSTPPDAGANYPSYLRTQLMAIAARLGIPYEVMTGDLTNVSDRALKLILNEFRRIIEQRQWLVLIPKFCQPVREAFIDAAVLAGALDAPGYADNRDAYVDTLWVPQGWPYSHPVQDVNADIKAVRAGFKSRSDIVLSNGDDPEHVDAQQTEDNIRADASHLVYDSDGRTGIGVNGVTPVKSQALDDSNPSSAQGNKHGQ